MCARPGTAAKSDRLHAIAARHRIRMSARAESFPMFRNKQDHCEKIVLKPQQHLTH
jgi:hypothetical protein